MNIDTYWQQLAIGRNQTKLVDVIQDGVKAFYVFVEKFDPNSCKQKVFNND